MSGLLALSGTAAHTVPRLHLCSVPWSCDTAQSSRGSLSTERQRSGQGQHDLQLVDGAHLMEIARLCKTVVSMIIVTAPEKFQ